MTGILIWMVRAKPNENSTLWRDEVSILTKLRLIKE